MPRVNLYPLFQKKSFYHGITIIALLIVIVSLAGLIYAFYRGFDTSFPGGDWTPAFNLVAGILLLVMTKNLWRQYYSFIEWDNKEIRYMLESMKKPVSIAISEIHEIKISAAKIEINQGGNIEILNLSSLDYKRLRKIKEYFEELKLRVEGMNAGE